MADNPVLQVRHLRTRIGIGPSIYNVVDDISFDLHRGRTLALVGESGCGKTMTALSLLRILQQPPVVEVEGEVLFQGRDLLRLSEKEMRAIRGGRIAMIFQDPASALNPVYTVGNQMAEAAELHLNLFGEEARERCLNALIEVGIPASSNLLDAYPHQLSGGMRQRVIIAMALLCEPDILIADEPTTALDVTIQAQVFDLMRRLQRKKETALLLITHDMGVVAELAHDVIVMYASQVVERGSVEQIFDHRAHPYTMALFDSRPTLETTRGTLRAIKGSVPALTHYPHGCRFHTRCPFVMAKCKTGEVPDFPLVDAHSAKCWLHDGSLESMEKWGRQ
ncbi:MAG: ABC transporter ATP-binding protein [Parachlamydia sp.]|nr:ABC transporter ATP-binding protein [Parachlamydia sp.]